MNSSGHHLYYRIFDVHHAVKISNFYGDSFKIKLCAIEI